MGFRAEVITAVLICIMIIFGKSYELSIYSFIVTTMIHIEKVNSIIMAYNGLVYVCVCVPVCVFNCPYECVTTLKSSGVNEKNSVNMHFKLKIDNS